MNDNMWRWSSNQKILRKDPREKMTSQETTGKGRKRKKESKRRK